MKSAIGIGALLADGLGDTIRVSLTEAPPAPTGTCKHAKKEHGEHICAPTGLSKPVYLRLAAVCTHLDECIGSLPSNSGISFLLILMFLACLSCNKRILLYVGSRYSVLCAIRMSLMF